MNRFTKGIVTGSLIAGAGFCASMLIADPSSRRKMARHSRNLSKKAEDFMDM